MRPEPRKVCIAFLGSPIQTKGPILWDIAHAIRAYHLHICCTRHYKSPPKPAISQYHWHWIEPCGLLSSKGAPCMSLKDFMLMFVWHGEPVSFFQASSQFFITMALLMTFHFAVKETVEESACVSWRKASSQKASGPQWCLCVWWIMSSVWFTDSPNSILMIY